MIKPRDKNLNTISEMKNGETRLIFYNYNNKNTYFFIKNNLIESFWIEEDNELTPGNVYAAIVNKYDKASGGYFVSVSEKQTVYIPSRNIHEVHLCNERTFDGRLYEGEQVLVQIKKSAYKDKRAQGNCKIIIPGMEDEQLSNLLEKGRHLSKYSVIYEALSFLQEIYIENRNTIKIVCNNKVAYNIAIKQLVKFIDDSKLNDIVSLYSNTQISLSALYGLKSKFEELTTTKVWLKNGGYIFINPTEAMIVIDVNSGKNSGKKTVEESALDTNLNAIDEILHHIQCRNLSGIIIIDFINQKNNESNNILIEKLKNGLSELNPPGIFIDMTKLGLVEITRKKIRSDIYENISQFDKTILL